MPIYELACKECGNQYERIVSFSAVFPACPVCGSIDVARLLSTPAIHFKGSGWYITDSKKEEEKKKAAAQKTDSNDSASDKPAESESAGSESAGNESKFETKNSSPSESKSDAKEEA